MLLAELDEDLARRYDDDEKVHAEPAHFTPPAGRFFVVRSAGEPVACGGYRRLDGVTAELKRMYVRPGVRRQGVARRLLAAIETAAAAEGYGRLWLETGLAQPEAIAMYAALGYTPIAPFGQFAGAPDQRCYGKVLPASSPSSRTPLS